MSVTIVINQIAAASFLVLVLAAAISDLRTYRIPNALTLAIILIYPIFALTSPDAVDWPVVLLIAAVVLVVGFVLFAFRLIGGGDVKLFVGCAFWAGPALIFDFLVVTALAGGALSLFLISPLGRGLAVAADARGFTRFRDFLTADVVPYGVAIAVGGLFVAVRNIVL